MRDFELLDNKYRIEQQLGEGGMGTVYRATHLGTKRVVAVKIIHPQLSSYEEFVERFRREAEAAGRLRHPNVVDVTDFGISQTNDGPVAYLVMEYLDGCSLTEILEEEGRLPISSVVEVLEQVCSAVDEAHQMGIVHRDIKPDNIWFEPNRRGGFTVKVLDFGLVKLGDRAAGPTISNRIPDPPHDDSSRTRLFAGDDDKTLIRNSLPELALPAATSGGGKFRSGDSGSNGRVRHEARVTGERNYTATPPTEELTRFGSIMGTPAYMSPEQCRGGPVDSRSDIYSLGVIAYRMLTGENPFAGNTEELIALHTSTAPLPVRERNRKVPRKLARLVMSALEKDPAKRPQTAGGFASALQAAIESTGQLLRHAIALYSEHFPSFIKISLIGYAPLIAVLVVSIILDSSISIPSLPPMMQNLIGVGIFAGIILTSFLAYFIVSAGTVPVVVQLMIAPLREVQLKTALFSLKRRWLPFVLASIIVLSLITMGAVLLLLPGAFAAIYFALYAPVVIMEDLGVWATLKRAGSLVRRAWVSVLTITLLQFVLPVIVWRASITTSFTLKLGDDYSPKEFGFQFSSSNMSALFQLLNIFVTPLTAIMISLLYLKTRQAGGESLNDASEKFEALDLPRSKWQSHLRRSFTGYTRR